MAGCLEGKLRTIQSGRAKTAVRRNEEQVTHNSKVYLYRHCTHHTRRSPELLPDRLDLTWRKQEAVAPGVRKLHREGVRDLRSVLKKAFELFMDICIV